MKIIIDISKDRYDSIMAMDWKNCRRFFDEEIRAIHDGKALEQEPINKIVQKAYEDGKKDGYIQAKVEQEPKTDTLDKIRAKIDEQREKLKIMADDDWYAGKIRGYDCAVEIIDKYKAESEDVPDINDGKMERKGEK